MATPLPHLPLSDAAFAAPPADTSSAAPPAPFWAAVDPAAVAFEDALAGLSPLAAAPLLTSSFQGAVNQLCLAAAPTPTTPSDAPPQGAAPPPPDDDAQRPLPPLAAWAVATMQSVAGEDSPAGEARLSQFVAIVGRAQLLSLWPSRQDAMVCRLADSLSGAPPTPLRAAALLGLALLRGSSAALLDAVAVLHALGDVHTDALAPLRPLLSQLSALCAPASVSAAFHDDALVTAAAHAPHPGSYSPEAGAASGFATDGHHMYTHTGTGLARYVLPGPGAAPVTPVATNTMFRCRERGSLMFLRGVLLYFSPQLAGEGVLALRVDPLTLDQVGAVSPPPASHATYGAMASDGRRLVAVTTGASPALHVLDLNAEGGATLAAADPLPHGWDSAQHPPYTVTLSRTAALAAVTAAAAGVGSQTCAVLHPALGTGHRVVSVNGADVTATPHEDVRRLLGGDPAAAADSKTPEGAAEESKDATPSPVAGDVDLVLDPGFAEAEALAVPAPAPAPAPDAPPRTLFSLLARPSRPPASLLPPPLHTRSALYATPTQAVFVFQAASGPVSRAFTLPTAPLGVAHVSDTPLAPSAVRASQASMRAVLGAGALGVEPPSGAAFSVSHYGVACDVCSVQPLVGPRYKDNEAADFDLCHSCYVNHNGPTSHAFWLYEEQRTRARVLPPRDDAPVNLAPGVRARAMVPSALAFDAVTDRLWAYFVGGGVVQCWRNPAPTTPAPPLTAGVSPPTAAAVVVHHMGRLARLVTAVPSACSSLAAAAGAADAGRSPAHVPLTSGADGAVIPTPPHLVPAHVDGLGTPVYRATDGALVAGIVPPAPVAITALADCPVFAAPGSGDAAPPALGTLARGDRAVAVERRGDWLRLQSFASVPPAASTAAPEPVSDFAAVREELRAARDAADGAGGRERMLAALMSAASRRGSAPPPVPVEHPVAWVRQSAGEGNIPVVAAASRGAPLSSAATVVPGTLFGGGSAAGWSGPPEALMGATVSVLWAGDKWYTGKVVQESDGKHFVLYVDGDKRWYRMADKTFRVVDVEPVATPSPPTVAPPPPPPSPALPAALPVLVGPPDAVLPRLAAVMRLVAGDAHAAGACVHVAHANLCAADANDSQCDAAQLVPMAEDLVALSGSASSRASHAAAVDCLVAGLPLFARAHECLLSVLRSCLAHTALVEALVGAVGNDPKFGAVLARTLSLPGGLDVLHGIVAAAGEPTPTAPTSPTGSPTSPTPLAVNTSARDSPPAVLRLLLLLQRQLFGEDASVLHDYMASVLAACQRLVDSGAAAGTPPASNVVAVVLPHLLLAVMSTHDALAAASHALGPVSTLLQSVAAAVPGAPSWWGRLARLLAVFVGRVTHAAVGRVDAGAVPPAVATALASPLCAGGVAPEAVEVDVSAVRARLRARFGALPRLPPSLAGVFEAAEVAAVGVLVHHGGPLVVSSLDADADADGGLGRTMHQAAERVARHTLSRVQAVKAVEAAFADVADASNPAAVEEWLADASPDVLATLCGVLGGDVPPADAPMPALRQAAAACVDAHREALASASAHAKVVHGVQAAAQQLLAFHAALPDTHAAAEAVCGAAAGLLTAPDVTSAVFAAATARAAAAAARGVALKEVSNTLTSLDSTQLQGEVLVGLGSALRGASDLRAATAAVADAWATANAPPQAEGAPRAPPPLGLHGLVGCGKAAGDVVVTATHGVLTQVSHLVARWTGCAADGVPPPALDAASTPDPSLPPGTDTAAAAQAVATVAAFDALSLPFSPADADVLASARVLPVLRDASRGSHLATSPRPMGLPTQCGSGTAGSHVWHESDAQRLVRPAAFVAFVRLCDVVLGWRGDDLPKAALCLQDDAWGALGDVVAAGAATAGTAPLQGDSKLDDDAEAEHKAGDDDAVTEPQVFAALVVMGRSVATGLAPTSRLCTALHRLFVSPPSGRVQALAVRVLEDVLPTFDPKAAHAAAALSALLEFVGQAAVDPRGVTAATQPPTAAMSVLPLGVATGGGVPDPVLSEVAAGAPGRPSTLITLSSSASHGVLVQAVLAVTTAEDGTLAHTLRWTADNASPTPVALTLWPAVGGSVSPAGDPLAAPSPSASTGAGSAAAASPPPPEPQHDADSIQSRLMAARDMIRDHLNNRNRGSGRRDRDRDRPSASPLFGGRSSPPVQPRARTPSQSPTAAAAQRAPAGVRVSVTVPPGCGARVVFEAPLDGMPAVLPAFWYRWEADAAQAPPEAAVAAPPVAATESQFALTVRRPGTVSSAKVADVVVSAMMRENHSLRASDRDATRKAVQQALDDGLEPVVSHGTVASLSTLALGLAAAGVSASIAPKPAPATASRNTAPDMAAANARGRLGGAAVGTLSALGTRAVRRLLAEEAPPGWRAAVVDVMQAAWGTLAGVGSSAARDAHRLVGCLVVAGADLDAASPGVRVAVLATPCARATTSTPLPLLSTAASVGNAYADPLASTPLATGTVVSVLAAAGRVRVLVEDGPQAGTVVDVSHSQLAPLSAAPLGVPPPAYLAALRPAWVPLLAALGSVLADAPTGGDALLVRLARSRAVKAVANAVTFEAGVAKALLDTPGLEAALRRLALLASPPPHVAVLVSGLAAAHRWAADSPPQGGDASPPPVTPVANAPQLPTDLDEGSLWHAVRVREPSGTVLAQYAGFLRRDDDPRRADRAGARDSEEVVFVADTHIPTTLPRFYFEVTLETIERSSRDAPAVAVGLWSDTALTRGAFGCEWGQGSFVFNGTDGSKSSFAAATPALSHTVGEPVDVKDVTGAVTWRPGVVVDARPDAVRVHYLGWERKWDEWLDKSSDRLAPSRTHTPGRRLPGFMARQAYAAPFVTRGDVIGCMYDVAGQRVSFTVNGAAAGPAFSDVVGEFRPAASVTTSHARLRFNFGAAPFRYTPASAATHPVPSLRSLAPRDARRAAAAAAAAAGLRARASALAEEQATASPGGSKRAKPCPCFARRNAAQELCDFLPDVEVGVVMRVLKMHNDDKHQTAEWLLTHGHELAGVAASDDSASCADKTHLFAASPGRLRAVRHCNASFSGFVPRAPGLSAALCVADPVTASAPLRNPAGDVGGSCVIVDRGECTFVEKVRHCQVAGALAVILVSDADVGFIPDCGAEACDDLTIPVMMIPRDDGEALKAAAAAGAVMITMKEGVVATEAPAPATPASPPPSATSPAAGGGRSPPPPPDVGEATLASVAVAEGGAFSPSASTRVELGASYGEAHIGCDTHGDPGGADGGGGSGGDGSAPPPAALSAEEEAWLASVEALLRQRRVPLPMIRTLTTLLRDGGENNMAMARTMLDDVGVSLPPRPEAPEALTSPSLGPSASPSIGALPMLRSPSQLDLGVSSNPAPVSAAAAPLTVGDLRPGVAVAVNMTPAELLSWRSAGASQAGQAAHGAPAGKMLSVGTSVKARWHGGGWYDGRVSAVHDDGTVDVAFNDGDREAHLPVERIRVKSSSGALQPARTAPPGDSTDGHRAANVWVPRMDAVAGGVGVVVRVDTGAGAALVRVVPAGGMACYEWWLPPSFLSLLPPSDGALSAHAALPPPPDGGGLGALEDALCAWFARHSVLAVVGVDAIAESGGMDTGLARSPPLPTGGVTTLRLAACAYFAGVTHGGPEVSCPPKPLATLAAALPSAPWLLTQAADAVVAAVGKSRVYTVGGASPTTPVPIDVGGGDCTACVATFHRAPPSASTGTVAFSLGDSDAQLSLLRRVGGAGDATADATRRRSTAARRRPLVVPSSRVWVRRCGSVDLTFTLVPVSPMFPLLLWLLEAFLASRPNDKALHEVAPVALDACVALATTPHMPPPLRCLALRVGQRVLGVTPASALSTEWCLTCHGLLVEARALHGEEAPTFDTALPSPVLQELTSFLTAARRALRADLVAWQGVVAGEAAGRGGAGTPASAPGVAVEEKPEPAPADAWLDEAYDAVDVLVRLAAGKRGSWSTALGEACWAGHEALLQPLPQAGSRGVPFHGGTRPRAPGDGDGSDDDAKPAPGGNRRRRWGSAASAGRDTVPFLCDLQAVWTLRQDTDLVAWVNAEFDKAGVVPGRQAAPSPPQLSLLRRGPLSRSRVRATSSGSRPTSAADMQCDRFTSTAPSVATYASLSEFTTGELRARFLLLCRVNQVVAAALPTLSLGDGALVAHVLATSDVRRVLFRDTVLAWVRRVCEVTAFGARSVRPRVVVNRFRASSAVAAGETVFGQLLSQLLAVHPAHLQQARTSPHLAFEVQLKQERVAGEGGPYREVFDDVARELTAAGDAQLWHLFTPTANAVGGVGDGRDCVLPSPRATSAEALTALQALGRLMGCGLRTNVRMPITLPSLFWKLLVDQPLALADLDGVDHMLVSSVVQPLQCASSAEEFDKQFGRTLRQATTLADGTLVEMVPGGADAVVAFADRGAYVEWLTQVHASQCRAQVQAVRLGLCEVVPVSLLRLLDWREARTLLCGDPEVDIDMLARHTEYAGGVDADSPQVLNMWAALRSFSQADRRKFVKFAWGQERLPPTDAAFDAAGVRLLIKAAPEAMGARPDSQLPRADTCFFNLSLPAWSTEAVAADRLLVAISLDAGLDGDDVDPQ